MYPLICVVAWLPEAGIDINEALSANGSADRIENSRAIVYAGHLLPMNIGVWIAVAFFGTNPEARELLRNDVLGKSGGDDSVDRLVDKSKI